jgi:hypothetical protein
MQFIIFCFRVCYVKLKRLKMYKSIILPVVLHVYNIWSVTLREDSRLNVFENRVLGENMDLGGIK